MANPQKENGSTDIANELLEAIYSFDFNGTEISVILCVLRYTYGFHRKKHELSLSFITKAIHRHRNGVFKAINDLIKKNVLIQYSSPSFNSTREIGINKDYSKWIVLQSHNNIPVTVLCDRPVTLECDTPVTVLCDQETKNNKLKNKLNNNIVHSANARECFERLWSLYPKKVGKKKAFDKYMKIRNKVSDEKIEDGIKKYIEYVKSQNFADKYIKNGLTWFNGECWNDEYEISREIEEREETRGNRIWQ